MNITDIDDKIIKGAAAIGEPIEVLTERGRISSSPTPRRCA